MTTNLAFTLDDLIGAVRSAAAEQPDLRLSDGCRYFYRAGTPCCIIGNALNRVGFTDLDMRAIAGDEENYSQWNEESFSALWPHLHDERYQESGVISPQGRWLNYAQHLQDAGHTWRESVELADQDRPLKEDG